MRLMIYELQPAALLKKGFFEAIECLVELFRARYHQNIHCCIEGAEDGIDGRVQLTLYRVLQECLNNVVKHARATEIEIDLKVSESHGELSVRDNGCGFKPESISQAGKLGIEGMEGRMCEIGGDFYDVLYINGKLNIVLADVSGKGVSAALLAAILQGLIYSHLMDDRPLHEAANAINQFLCSRDLGGKYATLFLGRIHRDGSVEWIRCGHVPPVRVQGNDKIERWEEGSMPVGLLPVATFEMQTAQLKPGDRLVVVSDGITEAENAADDLFGEERLEEACKCDDAFNHIMERVAEFRGATAQNDDATLLEVIYNA
jgi:hypothetical protein